ncbi:unnamed protein product [Linum trigynum]|uniref:Retrotransposon gag domain-containing protein n=1 Tax=Linum trigynum TaxID=586398 RepID=A0AAV2DUW8_9ROSI
MTHKVRNSVCMATTARAIGTDLQRRFIRGSAQRAYELRRTIVALRQEKLSISAFYTKLRSYWDEMDAVGGLPCCTYAGCSCGGCSCNLLGQFQARLESERLFDFLLGLDDAYSVVRSQILSTKPTPSLAEAYQTVAAEEQHRMLTAGWRPVVETVVFQAQADKDSKEEREKPRWSYCNKLGHL